MKRREFITLLGGAAVAWPLAARAQQGEPMRRIAVLVGLAEDDAEMKARLAGFRQGLEKRGWLEGRNVRIDYRFGATFAQAPVLAKELVSLQPDVLLAQGPGIAAAIQRETRTIPIVFAGSNDPIGAGFIASLARPGGNMTGLLMYEEGVTGKWLQMLKEIAPRVSRAAIIVSPGNTFALYLRAAEAMASSLAIELVLTPVENAADIARVIETFARVPNGGLILPVDARTTEYRALIIALAARHQLPAVYSDRVFVVDGGLMFYGINFVDVYRQAASYVDRILRGDKPADLPVRAPTMFETVINLRTAKTLGLTVPPGLLVAADEVIE
jgi:putative tryptophan/tyrosine transport system substrate-binding protein